VGLPIDGEIIVGVNKCSHIYFQGRNRHREGGWFVIPGLAISLGLSYLSGLLLRRKTEDTPQQIQNDDQPRTYATRNAPIPYVIGRHLVEPSVTWLGRRNTLVIETEQDAGGKGGGGGEVVTTETRYFESARHDIALGPVHALYRIYQAGPVLWDDSITRTGTPSGTQVNVSSDPDEWFRPYWGEIDQPGNSIVTGDIGLATRNALCASVFWGKKYLGGSGYNWPQLKYDIGVFCQTNLSDEYLIEYSGTDQYGINPAHIIWQLLTASHPYGAGIDPDLIDMASLLEMAETCFDENVGMNIRMDDTPLVRDVVASICEDIGYMPVQVGRRLVFRRDRRDDDFITLAKEHVIPPLPLLKTVRGNPMADRVTFNMQYNARRKFRNTDFGLPDDTGSTDAYRYRDIPLVNVTHIEAARAIAPRRRKAERGDRASFDLTVAREAAFLEPGEKVYADGMGVLRLLATRRSGTGEPPTASWKAVVDTLASSPVDYTGDEGVEGEGSLAPAPDLSFNWIVVETPGGPVMYVARIRAHSQIAGAGVWIESGSSGNYTQYGSQNAPAAGGPVVSPIEDTDGSPIDEGPYFIAMNDDIENAMDLSGDSDSWNNGRQLALINQEVFFLERIEAVGSEYYTRGLGMSPLIYYRLGEPSGSTAVNEGSEGDGTYAGTPTFGVEGSIEHDDDTAVEFDGSTEYIVSDTTAFDPTASWTIAARVQATVSGTHCIVGQMNGAGTGRNLLEIRSGNYSSFIAGSFRNSGVAPSSGAWDTVILRYDAGDNEITFIINGVVGSPISVTPEAASGNIVVGVNKNLSSDKYDGYLDELIIAQYAITDDEAQAMHAARNSELNGYRARNLIRAQYGTVAADHAREDTIYIIDQLNLTTINSLLIVDSASLCVKTRPHNGSALVALGDVTPVCGTVDISS